MTPQTPEVKVHRIACSQISKALIAALCAEYVAPRRTYDGNREPGKALRNGSHLPIELNSQTVS